MTKRTLTRRDFLLSIPAAWLGLSFLDSGSVGRVMATDTKGLAKPPAPRPPGTCGGWTDTDKNGICNRSEQGEKRCKARKCPGNRDNPLRQEAEKKGAPKGTCALWEDPPKKGFCAISSRDKETCVYEACPAHAKSVARDKKAPAGQ